MGADQQRRGVHDWALITLRNDGFSMEIVEGISTVLDKWAALKRDPSVRAVYAYDPNGSYHDSWTRK